MVVSIISFVFLAVLLLFSPRLIKLGWMSGFQAQKLRAFLFHQIPKEILTFLFILVPVALIYVAAYFINGHLNQATEADLPRLSINFFRNVGMGYDDLGLKYSLSGWWGIIFLSFWINMIRFFYEGLYRLKFPYSEFDYSSWLLLLSLSAAMAYFSIVGGSSLYGFTASMMFLAAYTLVHIIVCLLIYICGFKQKCF